MPASESILDGSEDSALTHAESMLRTAKCTIGDILITPFVEKIISRDRQTDLIVQVPDGRNIKQYEGGMISFRETCQEMFRTHGKLQWIAWYYCNEQILMKGVVVVVTAVYAKS